MSVDRKVTQKANSGSVQKVIDLYTGGLLESSHIQKTFSNQRETGI